MHVIKDASSEGLEEAWLKATRTTLKLGTNIMHAINFQKQGGCSFQRATRGVDLKLYSCKLSATEENDARNHQGATLHLTDVTYGHERTNPDNLICGEIWTNPDSLRMSLLYENTPREPHNRDWIELANSKFTSVVLTTSSLNTKNEDICWHEIFNDHQSVKGNFS